MRHLPFSHLFRSVELMFSETRPLYWCSTCLDPDGIPSGKVINSPDYVPNTQTHLVISTLTGIHKREYSEDDILVRMLLAELYYAKVGQTEGFPLTTKVLRSARQTDCLPP